MTLNNVQRVVVLGRDGPARNQLVSALSDLGVSPVWVGSPSQTSPESLGMLSPTKVVVSLDPAMELELESYSDFLSQPAVTVLFDDAETTSALGGWDLNRWARHMAAKLLDRDVLPPLPMDAHAKAALQESDDGIMGYKPIGGSHDEIPSAPEFVGAPASDDSAHWQDTGHYDDLAIDSDELALALQRADSEIAHGAESHEIKIESEQLLPLTEDEQALLNAGQETARPPEKLDIGHSGSMQWHDGDAYTFDINSDDLDSALRQMDDTLKHPPAELDEDKLLPLTDEEESMFNTDIDTTLMPDFEDKLPQMAEKVQVPAAMIESNLTLAMDDADIAAQIAPVGGAAPLKEYDLSGLSIVEEYNGPVLHIILYGIGGPGVVRTILQNVPESFSGILVLSQKMGITQLDRLRNQLQKMTNFPISVAESEEYLKAGEIYLLPANIGLQNTQLGYKFESEGDLSAFIQRLPQEVKVLVLSGADQDLSQPLKSLGKGAPNIRIQAPDDCYEPALVRELAEFGMPVLNLDSFDKWLR